MKLRSQKSKARHTAESIALAKRRTSANATRAEALLELIARRVQRIKEDFFDVGVALKELRDKKLYVALGFKTFEAMLEARSPVGRSQAYKLIAVVRQVTREEALALGPEKAYALTRFVRATPEPDTVASVIEDDVRIGANKRSLRTMSRRQIETATRDLVSAKRRPSEAERDARRAAREAQATLRQRARDASVAIVHEHGAWWAVVRVPARQLPSLVGER